MIFYPSESKSKALRQALQDGQWSEQEKKALAKILKFVEIEEENTITMTTEEWINNPVDLSSKYPDNVACGSWLDNQYNYAYGGQKYMVEYAGTGYRIGKCYPEPDLVGKS